MVEQCHISSATVHFSAFCWFVYLTCNWCCLGLVLDITHRTSHMMVSSCTQHLSQYSLLLL